MGVPELRPQFPNLGNVLAKGAAIKGQEARTGLMQSQNVLAQKRIGDYDEDRKWLQKEQKRTETKWKQEDKDRFLKLSDEERDRAIKIVDTAANWLNGTETVGQYAEMRPIAIEKLGIDEKQYPDPSVFMKADGTPDNESYTEWKNSKVKQASNWKKQADFTLTETSARFKAEGGKPIAKGAKWGKEGELGGLTDGQALKWTALTLKQKIDHADKHYSIKKSFYEGDFGVRDNLTENEKQEYKQLIKDLEQDKRTIHAGGNPSYLEEEEVKPRVSWRDYQ